MGRPSKLNPAVQDQICTLLQRGIPRARCAALAGIDDDTFRLWFNRGVTEGAGPYRDFYLAVMKAEAMLHQTVAEMLMSHVASDPKTLLSWMGRRFPEEFGRRDNVDVQSPEDKAANEQALRSLLIERLERFAPIEDAEVLPADSAAPALPSGEPEGA